MRERRDVGRDGRCILSFLSLSLAPTAFSGFYLNHPLVFHVILISYISLHCDQLMGTQLRPVSPQLSLQREVTLAEDSRQRGSLQLPANSSGFPLLTERRIL